MGDLGSKTAEGLVSQFNAKKKWRHCGKFKPSTNKVHEPLPYARRGDENRCETCGDKIEEVKEEPSRAYEALTPPDPSETLKRDAGGVESVVGPIEAWVREWAADGGKSELDRKLFAFAREQDTINAALLAALKEIQETAFDYAHGKPAFPTPTVNARWLLKVTNEAIAKAEGR